MLLVLFALMSWHHSVRSDEICCPNIGCFSDDSPFNDIALPQCIEEMTPHFYMFTRANVEESEEFSHTTVPSVYDGTRRTVFLVHGWNSNGNSVWVNSMKNTLLDKEDINAVVVDWGGGAELLNYFQAASNTRSMGAYAALVFDNLVNNGGSSGRTWCMGHSLGAHLCGHAGMRTTLSINRVTGLDPAGPWFQGKLDRTVGLNPTSAQFVDVIHTDTQLGQLRDLGHIDFYPGGGASQPGCLATPNESETSQMNACAHSRAHQYMEQSVKADCFLSRSKCSDYSDIPGSCIACTCGSNPCARLGYEVEAGCQITGWFYVEVTSATPFCVD